MAWNVKNCPMCGNLFVPVNNSPVCQNCQAKYEELEKQVVDYVRDHPRVSVAEVMKETEAPESLIKRLIREGRFEQIGVKMSYPCERCGKPIYEGRFCQDCLAKMRQDVQEQAAKIVAAREIARRGKEEGNRDFVPKRKMGKDTYLSGMFGGHNGHRR